MGRAPSAPRVNAPTEGNGGNWIAEGSVGPACMQAVPDQILIAFAVKLTLYGFDHGEGPFPQFLRI